MVIYTIGHSTRTWEEFQKILKSCDIKLLADVRTVPKSRHVPHFNWDALKNSLHGDGIEYQHHKKLGGLRKAVKDSVNSGWRNASFRGFADYMQTEEFWESLQNLIEMTKEKKTALMCAEAVPWRCHRWLIADALIVKKLEAVHILSRSHLRSHHVTPFAVVKEDRMTYPQVKADGSSG